MNDDIGGVWRTIGGRRIFIKDGEDLITAMKNSGKFENKKEINNEFNKKLNKTIQNIQDKRDNDEELTENEFYKLYSAHKLLNKNEEEALKTIKSIQEKGFNTTGGFGTNLVPSKILYDTNGNPQTYGDKEYAPKKGEYVIFVPEKYVDDKNGKYRVGQGFKPKDYEYVKVERDNQPYYELYKKHFK